MREEVGKLVRSSHLFEASAGQTARYNFAGIGTWTLKTRSNRLPWFHRASPSTTLNEIRYINECGYIDELVCGCQIIFLKRCRRFVTEFYFASFLDGCQAP